MVGGALIGSLPWWYANVGSGFASLRRSAFPAGGGLGYGARLSVFFRDMLPLQLGVRTVFGGAWVGGAHLGHVLFVLVLAVVAAGIVRAVWVRRGDTRCLAPVALAGGIVVFPFLYAAVPASGYWVDGRYGLYLPFLVVPLLALALPGQARPASLPPAEPVEEHASRRGLHAARRPQVPSVTSIGALIGAGLGVLGATLLSVGAAHAGGVPASPRFFTSWGDPNAQTRQVVHEMLTHHVADAYGNYWTAYDLEFIGQGSVTVSPSVLDVDRWPALAAKVAASPDPAWLFIAPGKTAAADAAFLNTQPGPGSYTERSFEARLTELGVTYRVVHLGVLDAVVPSRRVLVP
jgi:hypothetical protein